MIKTILTTDKIQRTLNTYNLTHIETVKLTGLKNNLVLLSGQEINEKTKIVMTNNRGLLISMIKDALTDYDFALAHELYSILKTIGKL
jgi:hypothetical protein